MTRNTRLALVAAVVVIAVVAFVIAKPGDDGDTTADRGAAPATTGKTSAEPTDDGGQNETQPTARQPEPAVTRIAIAGQRRRGAVKTITVQKGDRVRIVVTADAPNLIHLHGYDIEEEAAPGRPARFDFKANLEGEFELESHTFSDAGLEAALGRLRVEPA
jgi:FtsP/CotA-like multicopper oxidase with cupredoxin domain